MLTNIEIELPRGIVAGKVIVDKAVLCLYSSEEPISSEIYGVIDIKPQPSYSTKF